MEYILSILLTFVFVLGIINLIRWYGKIPVTDILLSQSEIHNLTKDFIPEKESEEPISQLQKRRKENLIKIIAIDGKAYWVADNIFYSADIINDIPDFTNAVPVDTINMSQQDLDKMVFVLDNLTRGKRDDSSSSGQQ